MLVTNGAYALGEWGIVILIARYQGAEYLGIYGLAKAVLNPLLGVGNLQLRAVYATDYEDAYSFNDYLSTRVVVAVGAIFIGILMALIIGDGMALVSMFAAIAALKLADGLSDIEYARLQKNETMLPIAKSTAGKVVLMFGAVWSALIFTDQIEYGFVVAAVLWVVWFIVVDRKGKIPKLLEKFSFSKTGDIIRIAAPLGLSAGVVALAESVPRLILNDGYGASAVGQYTAISYFALAMVQVTGAVGQSTRPRIARAVAEEEWWGLAQSMGKLLGVAAVIGLVSAVGGVIAGREVLVRIYGGEYGVIVQEFQLLLVGGVVFTGATATGYIVTGLRRFRGQAIARVLRVATVIIVGVMLIYGAGLRGAVLTVVSGAFVECAVNVCVIAQDIREKGKLGLSECRAIADRLGLRRRLWSGIKTRDANGRVNDM